MSVLDNAELAFLHRSVAFLTINSFSNRYVKPSAIASRIFVRLYERIPPDFIVWMIDRVHLTNQFPYAITTADCRNLFAPILKQLEQGPAVTATGRDFLACFMRNLVLELHRVYSQSSLELSPDEKQLSDVSVSFASLVCEAVGGFFNASAIKTPLERNPLFIFCMKWLVLFEPFANFLRTSHEVTVYLFPLFKTMGCYIAEFDVD
jgi:hypothetical protein